MESSSVPHGRAKTVMADLIHLMRFAVPIPLRYSIPPGCLSMSSCPFPWAAWGFAASTALQRGAFGDVSSRFRAVWIE